MIRVKAGFTLHPGRVSKKLIEGTVRSVLEKEGVKRASVQCIFLDDESIQKLNKQCLGHDYPTDVITFPMETEPELEAELYIGLETARLQAKEYGVSVNEEVARLVIHGILHLCGYNDKNKAMQAEMREAEDRYIELLKLRRLLRP